MFKKTINFIENQQISFWNIIFLIYIASFIRGFLEAYINSYNNNKITVFVDMFFHYPLWFLGVFLSLCIIITLITKEKIEKTSKLWAYLSFIIIIPIIIDFFIGKNNIFYSFIVGGFKDIIKSFFTFISPIIDVSTGIGVGISYGIRIEIFISLILIGLYIFIKTNNISKIIKGISLSYLIIFIFLMFPSLLFSVDKLISNNFNNSNNQSVITFYKDDFIKSNTSNRTFITSFDKNKNSLEQEFEKQSSITLTICFLLTDIILFAWCFWIYDRKKFIAVIKNFRYLRIIHYFLMITLGFYLGYLFSNQFISSWFDLFSVISVYMAILFAWLFSVWENDEVDLEIDKISNSKRPLPQGLLTKEEWSNIKYFFLFISLNFAFLSGFYTFIFTLLYLIVYHLYSANPLRLKKVLILSSILIAINALIAVFIGFFIIAGTENLTDFPIKYLLSILIFFFFLDNIKNIKDIEGDKIDNIKTLPVILGEKNSKLIFGFITFIICLIIPFLFYLNILTIINSIIFGSLLFYFINKKEFKENYIFILYFVFVIFFVLLNIFT